MATTSRPIPAPAVVKSAAPEYKSGIAVVFALALAKFAILLWVIRGYGYFRDELYYLALAQHPLGWGYVDLPPLLVVITKAVRDSFGTSLVAIRFLPAVAGAATVWLGGMLAREMGGRRWAQILAALATSVALVYWPLSHILSMNAFEPLFWMGSAWTVAKIARTGNQRWWLWTGVLVGLGVLNKYSMVFFAVAVVIGILLTPLRTSFKYPWIWMGIILAVAMAYPNFEWQASHHFPFLELMRNIRHSGRDTALGPFQFLKQQMLIMNPVTLPAILSGLGWLLYSRQGNRFRALGVAFLVLLGFMILTHGKDYYLAPAYVMLFAAAGVFFETHLRSWLTGSIFALYILALLSGLVLVPLTIPILSEEAFIAYANKIGVHPSESETHRQNALGQFFADMHGWPEMAEKVADAYNTLTPEEQADTVIFAQNYGEAGAIDLFGESLGLPKAISGHQQYWYWGPKGSKGGNLLLLGRHSVGDLPQHCQEVREMGQVGTEWSIPYEHWTIYFCRNVDVNLADIWPREKAWD
jgi:MFS family permease